MMARVGLIAPETQSRRESVATLRKAWGEWLAEKEWDHFATLTFTHPNSSWAARREFRRWIRRLEQRAQRRVSWFFVAEKGAAETLHLHALVCGTRRLPDSMLADAWSNGRCDVSAYDRQRGAAHYLAKQIGGLVMDYDMRRPSRAVA